VSQEAKNTEALETLIKVAAHGGPILPFDRTFSLAPVKPVPGTWYFCVDCSSCRRTSPVARDFSGGRLGKPFSGEGIKALCHFCQATIRARGEQMAPFQWA